MKIDLTGHHIELTPSLRNYVNSKFERLQPHFDNKSNTHVILTVEKDRQKAEATVNVNRGRLFAEAEHEDMYAAIDNLVDKLDRQVKKHKEKLTRNRRSDTKIKNNDTVE